MAQFPAVAQPKPTGTVVAIAATSAPAGWLLCDGSAVSRRVYASLSTAVATTFGAGNGSTTFKLPDLRGEFVRDFHAGRGIDANRASVWAS